MILGIHPLSISALASVPVDGSHQREHLRMGDHVYAHLVWAASESIVVEANTLTTLTPRLYDAFTLSAPTSARVDLNALFSDQLTLIDPVRFAVHQLLADTLNLADLTTEDIRRLALAAELIQVSEAVSPLLSVGATAHEPLTLADHLRFALETSAPETLALTDLVTGVRSVGEVLAELVQILDLPLPRLDVAALATETMTLDDALVLLSRILLSEGLTLEDEATAVRALRERLREALAVQETPAATLTVAQTLLEHLIAEDIAAFVRQATASEVLALADELTSAIIAQLTAPEALTILDEVSSSLVVLRTASEDLTLDESGSISLTAQLLAGERLAFIGRLPLGGDVFSAWVLNTDTLGATSYTQFPMLALATHQGRTYGLTETGLYELTGETDDGEPIPAVIETGALDFALHQDKNIPRAYLYLWAEGTMRLRTISSKRGCREEAWYEVTPMIGNDEQARIVRLARGVRGTTWQFRIENVDGCDFDLRGAEVLPVVLNKRGART